MKNFLCLVLFLFSFSFLHSTERSSPYEIHLPKLIYDLCKSFIDEKSPENYFERTTTDGETDQLAICLENFEEMEFALIHYTPGKIEKNFGGMEVAYQNKKLISAATFEADGAAYLVNPPFSEEVVDAIVDVLEQWVFLLPMKG